MIDTYLVSDDAKILGDFCAAHPNAIGPVHGHCAFPEYSLEDVTVIPAQPAIGDPLKSYACVRSNEELVLPQGIFTLESETGLALLGSWA